MSKLIELIKNNDCDYIGKVDINIINEAQEKLNIKFPEEIIEYISEFGVLSYGSNEINGLGTNSYLNIVNATIDARNNFTKFPNGLFVIQDIGINDLLILSDSFNNIYEWNGDSYKLIFNSFYDFLNQEIFKNEKYICL